MEDTALPSTSSGQLTAWAQPILPTDAKKSAWVKEKHFCLSCKTVGLISTEAVGRMPTARFKGGWKLAVRIGGQPGAGA